MNDVVKMAVEPRPGVGKGAARAARRAGYVPAVIYGAGEPPVSIQLKGNELLKTLQQGGFYTTRFSMEVDGKTHQVIPKDMQKNLLNGLPTHVDFLRLGKDSQVVVEIPVHFINEEECPGLKRGATLNVVRHTVEMTVPASAMPDAITIDLSTFDIGDGIHISHVKLPPKCVPTITDRDFTIATIAAPSALKSEGTEAEGADADATEADAGSGDAE